MDAKLDKPLATVTTSEAQSVHANAGQLIVRYWIVATVLGAIFLWDWISAWNVPLTLGNLPLVIYLIASFALSQVLYALVATYGGRPIDPVATVLFGLGNGLAETFAFALVYRLGEVIGGAVVGSFAPGAASVAGFVTGIAFFCVYGGLIHALFWLRVLPPHLNDTPRATRIRKLRPLAEVALVLGWSLCFWLYRDIWTVVFFHFLVDIGLMVKVRPELFGRVATE